MNEIKVWRILDASLNRASEGLRTIEEYTRFVLDDASLTAQLKQLRHDVAAAGESFPIKQLLAARDTPGDVGTRISNDSEATRANVQSVVAAASARVQQSLRCLEEYGKVVDGDAASRFEAARYRAYTIFAALEQITQAGKRLGDCQLYVLVDGNRSVEAMIQLVVSLACAGVDIIQLRDKQLTDRDLYQRARAAVEALRPSDCRLIVNDRPDIAIAAGAWGVHVGQDELPAATVRQLIGPEMILGVSTHNIDQARRASLQGADYIGCGPTFASKTKSFDRFAGLEFLEQVAAEISLPAFAIGGIDASNIDQVCAAGIVRVAVSGAVVGHADPAAAAAKLKSALPRLGITKKPLSDSKSL